MASSPGPMPPPPNLRLVLVVAAVIALLAVAALWPKGGAPAGNYAVKVVAFEQGRIQPSGCPAREPKNALGPPDNNYVPIGIGGRIVLELSIPARDVRDLTLYEATGLTFLVPSQAHVPLLQQIGNETHGYVDITSTPLWPLGGDKIAQVDFDPSSRTPNGFTRVVIFDQSQEPVKCTSGIDLDAVQVASPAGAP